MIQTTFRVEGVADRGDRGPHENQDIAKRHVVRGNAAGSEAAGAAAYGRGQSELSLSLIMPTVSWTGAFSACGRRALAAVEQAAGAAELIVVFDGLPPPRPSWLDRPGVTVLKTGRRLGPATARNLAAGTARGRILFFVDADVEISMDALDRVISAFDADPDLAGIFGAYDDEPAADGVVSRFRNLLHHHTHVAHPGRAGTFWSGCGAIATPVFLDVGGFDESYRLPSVEDIELGMRVAAENRRITLDPDLRCKHLKQWTFSNMIVADVMHRATPWTKLILSSRHLPTTLNIDWIGRISGISVVILVASLLASSLVPAARWVALASALTLAALNLSFYRLCLRKGGLGFAISSFALHALFFLYSTITFGVVVLRRCLNPLPGPGSCQHPISDQNTPATAHVGLSAPTGPLR